MRHFTGKSGLVTADAQTLYVGKWEATPSAELVEDTHSGSDGKKSYIVGNMGLTGTFEMGWDAAANPTEDPLNLNPGQEVALKLYLEGDSGPYLDVPAALISETPIAVPNETEVTITVNWTANGDWTMPVGDF